MILKVIKRTIQKLTSINSKNWNFYLKFFPWIEKSAGLFNMPVLKKLAKKAALLDSEKKHFSQGYIIPLDHDLKYSENYKNTVLPYNLLEDVIKNFGHIV